jgi:hypothetical protein
MQKKKGGWPISQPPLTGTDNYAYLSPIRTLVAEVALVPQMALVPQIALVPHTPLVPHIALVPQMALVPQIALVPHTPLVPQIALFAETELFPLDPGPVTPLVPIVMEFPQTPVMPDSVIWYQVEEGSKLTKIVPALELKVAVGDIAVPCATQLELRAAFISR